MKRVLVAAIAVCFVLAGTAAWAQAPSFSNASLNGTYVFRLHADGTTGSPGTPYTYSMVGVFTADGNGNITGGQFDLNNGAAASPQAPNTFGTGSYAIDGDGRGQITLGAANAHLPNSSSGNLVLSVALTSATRGHLAETNTNETARGLFQQQTASPSLATISGNYAVSGVGYLHSLTSSGTASTDVVNWIGQVAADGAGSISGTVDAGVIGGPQANFPVAATFAFTSGRTQGTSSGTTAVLYSVDNTTAYVMTLGPQAAVSGSDVGIEVLGSFELQQ